MEALIAISLRDDQPITGKTLGALADYASERGNAPGFEWHPTYTTGSSPGNRRVDLNGFDTLIVPDPVTEETNRP